MNGDTPTGGHFTEGESDNEVLNRLNSDRLHIQGRMKRGEPYESLCGDLRRLRKCGRRDM